MTEAQMRRPTPAVETRTRCARIDLSNPNLGKYTLEPK